MITDYSEITSKLNKKISDLNKHLNDKQYPQARIICNEITNDMDDLWQWSLKEEENESIPLAHGSSGDNTFNADLDNKRGAVDCLVDSMARMDGK